LCCKRFGACWERLGSLAGGESGIRTHGTGFPSALRPSRPPKMPPHANSVAILKEIDPKAVFSN
jgi:hypothetical protein